MPLDAGGARTKLASKKETFLIFIRKMAEVDFGPIVYFLKREDKNHWTEEKALSELENFKAFFVLCGIARFPVVPTKDIDEVWHACIFHTEFYARLCNEIFGRFIHHRPSDGKTEAKTKLQVNFRKTSMLFSKMTGRQYFISKAGCNTTTCDNCGNCDCNDKCSGVPVANVVVKADCCNSDCGSCGACDRSDCGCPSLKCCAQCSN